MNTPQCPDHLCDLNRMSWARIWECPHCDYQIDDITVVQHASLKTFFPLRDDLILEELFTPP